MFDRSIAPILCAALVVICACEEGSSRPADAGIESWAARPSRSSTLAVSRDGQLRVLVNPDLGRLVLERSGSITRPALFADGSWPSSVAMSPLADLAFVTLRKERALAIVEDLGGRPRVRATLPVCSEPTGVALSPTGRFAVVACFGEPLAVVIDTANFHQTAVPLAGVARAVAITNDGDDDDLDEHAYVTLFYGSPVLEGSDTGRLGKVAEIDLRRHVVSKTIVLNPVADLGFGPSLPDGGEGPHAGCSPNQLAAIAIAGSRAFVVHECVSPQPPLQPLTTFASVVSEIDLIVGRELRSASLSRLVREQGPPGDSLLGLPVDIDVDRDGTRAAVLSQAGNRVALLAISPSGPLALIPSVPGSTSTPIILDSASSPCGYQGCVAPQDPETPARGVPLSVALAEDGSIAVNDWTGGSLIDVGRRTSLYAPPLSQPRDLVVRQGRRFFYTGQDRWSVRDVGSCASCHPDGLSDNITWVFGAGPRQTTPLDGTFAKGNASDHRAQNWTAIFDEVQDVESATRNILGGKGAICRGEVPFDVPISLNVAMFLDGGVQVRNDNLSGSARFVVDNYANLRDWNDIDVFVQDVRANRAPTLTLDTAAAARGRAIFAFGGCPSCHGGPKWTSSRVPYAPSPEKNGSAVGDKGTHPLFPTGLRTELRVGPTHPLNYDTYKVAPEVLTGPNGASVTIGPERITCVLRDVGTFDANDPFERKADGSQAQGALGFNPPSLLGLETSAPYFHAGEARTLTEIFSSRFAAHTQAGQRGFDPRGQDLTDLIEFLRSIDETTAPFPSSMTVDICDGY